MTEIKVDNVVNVAGSGKPNFSVAPTHSSGSAISTLNTYQYDTTARAITVVSSGGNKYAIDGVTAPSINLLRGVTYVFDQSDSSNTNHPLRFKKADDSSFTVVASGTPGQSGATVTIIVPTTGDMPASYYCTVHGAGMGNTVTTSVPKNGALVWDSVEARPMVYINSEFKNLQLNTALPPTVAWWGTRGMAVGGEVSGYSNKLEYIDITTLGNGTDFGDLTESTSKTSSGSNGSRGVRIGGQVNTATMDYWAFATAGNATDFGDALVGRNLAGSVADGTKIITGSSIDGGYKNDIEYITVATTGNGTDFGDMTGTAAAGLGTTNDTTRGIFAGTQGGTKAADSFEYITMSTPGNATDYGNLATTLSNGMVGVVSDNTYGVFMGGVSSYSNVIQYMTIQSSANGTDFGDLSLGMAYAGQTSDATSKRGMHLGAYVNIGGSNLKLGSISYITIDTPGNATDFGNLTAATERASGCSGAAS